jgi:hypothetical protein
LLVVQRSGNSGQFPEYSVTCVSGIDLKKTARLAHP